MKKNHKGQFILEVLIGIAVISIAIAGIGAALVVAIGGINSNIKRSSQAMLMENAFQGVEAIARGNWNDLYRPLATDNRGTGFQYGVEVAMNGWILTGGSQSISLNDDFTRWLTIENVNRTATNGGGNIGGSNLDTTTLKVTVHVTASGLPELVQTRYYTRHFARSGNNVCIQQAWGTDSSGPIACPPGMEIYVGGAGNTEGLDLLSGLNRTANGSTGSFLTSGTIDAGQQAAILTIRWEGQLN